MYPTRPFVMSASLGMTILLKKSSTWLYVTTTTQSYRLTRDSNAESQKLEGLAGYEYADDHRTGLNINSCQYFWDKEAVHFHHNEIHFPGCTKITASQSVAFSSKKGELRKSCHPPGHSYLFLGDYVDRGTQGMEILLTLLAMKTVFPENVFLCRGNHEDFNTSLQYGFYDECVQKFEKEAQLAWLHIVNAFNSIPIAALINEKILCMHGGISPDLRSLEQIEEISRPTAIPPYGLLCDLLWSDPEPSSKKGWSLSSRGISVTYDDSVIESLLNRLGVELVIRAHQMTSDMVRGGYKIHASGRMLTIFSAPNYLNMGNDSCVAIVDPSVRTSC